MDIFEVYITKILFKIPLVDVSETGVNLFRCYGTDENGRIYEFTLTVKRNGETKQRMFREISAYEYKEITERNINS